jgi:hypothetical protein
MLDLKAKLLEAGVVSEDDAERVEREEADKQRKKAQRQADKKERSRWKKRITQLQSAGKSEQYETIRGWVQRTRLDPEKGLPSEEADRFHYETADGKVSWLTLEPDVKEKITKGEAGIIAWMSFNGLKHCVVPRDVAEDVGAVRPEWVRHLDGFDVVKKQDEPPAEEAGAAPDAAPEEKPAETSEA